MYQQQIRRENVPFRPSIRDSLNIECQVTGCRQVITEAFPIIHRLKSE